jgi:hypothetical protein
LHDFCNSLFVLNYVKVYVIQTKYGIKKPHSIVRFMLWAHLGSNQGPPDYESGALTS